MFRIAGLICTLLIFSATTRFFSEPMQAGEIDLKKDQPISQQNGLASPKATSEQALPHVTDALRFQRAGKIKEARLEFEKALLIDPDCCQAHWQQGELLVGDQWVSARTVRNPLAVQVEQYLKLREILARTARPLVFDGGLSEKHVSHSGNSSSSNSPEATPHALGTTRFLRRTFHLSHKPTWARLQIAAEGSIVVLLNGQIASHSRLSDHRGEAIVTNKLHQGQNIIAIALTANETHQRSGVLARLDTILNQDEVEVVSTDDQWLQSKYQEPHWYTVGHDDSSWPKVVPSSGNDLKVLEYRPAGDADDQEELVHKKIESTVALSPNQTAQVECWLAQWCQRHELSEQSRHHWYNVLKAAPKHHQALAELEVAHFENRLVPKSEVPLLQADKRERTARFSRHRVTLSKLAKEFCSQDESRKTAARTALSQQPEESLDVLVDLVARCQLKQHATEQLALEYLKLNADDWRSQATTDSLLKLVCDQPSDPIRMAAIDALYHRPLESFVPQSLRRMKDQIDATIHLTVYDSDAIIVKGYAHQDNHEQTFDFLNEQRFLIHHYHPQIHLRQKKLNQLVQTTDFVSAWQQANLQAEIDQRTAETHCRAAAEAAVAKLERMVEKENHNIATTNNRVTQLLARASGEQLGSNAEDWWNWWDHYNSVYDPQTPKSVKVVRFDRSRQFNYRGKPELRVHSSCFVAGTPVATDFGPRAIETIRPGDCVLSQNAQTGELAFRTVQAVTVRPTTATRSITINGETIVSTLGHRFWRYEVGWTMAKFLIADDQLHTLDGPRPIQAVTAGPDSEAYNLVVDDFHTYFVGKTGLLVHDNQLPALNHNSFPGCPSP